MPVTPSEDFRSLVVSYFTDRLNAHDLDFLNRSIEAYGNFVICEHQDREDMRRKAVDYVDGNRHNQTPSNMRVVNIKDNRRAL